jgi:hypothetical protein
MSNQAEDDMIREETLEQLDDISPGPDGEAPQAYAL